MKSLPHALYTLSLAFAMATTVTLGIAQTFPTKPIRLIVPFAAGSTSDVVARQMAPRLTELLGQGVVVDNRPGGGGTVATEAVARMPPDGYNILMASNAQFVVAPILFGAKLKYRPETDFTVLGSITRSPSLLLVSSSDAAPKTVEELVVRLKATPGNFGSTGTGGLTHLAGELLVHQLGVKATHVPYRGSSQALTDVVTGEVLFAIDSPAAAASLLRAGRLRALAVAGTQRLDSMKDIPTLAERGIKDVNVYAWFALFAPAGLAPEVAHRLRAAVAQAAAEPEMKQRLTDLQLESYVVIPAELERAIREDQPFWKKLIDTAGIQLPQ